MVKSFAPKSLQTKRLSRMGFLRLAACMGATLVSHRFAAAQTRYEGEAMQTRPIPSSGEALPVIGCGTYVGFDVGANSDKFKALADVVHTLRNAGGKVFDSSPMHGRAEAVVGELLAGAPDPKRTFIATKVWTRGRQAGITQMELSFTLLKAKRIDLMQQSGRLGNASSDAAALEAGRPHPLLGRHALHRERL
jgi:Aldo/keto reductase family